MITKKSLPRRTFLRGLGASVSLPLLDAMIPSMTAAAQTVAAPSKLRRIGYVYMPMGCDVTRWTPPNANTLDELSPTLSPLAKVKDSVTAITNRKHRLLSGHHRRPNCSEHHRPENSTAVA